MYRIVKKEALKPTVTLYEIEAPMVAKKAEPGQFIILRVDENGERIPITIHDFDREKGTVTIIVQTIGATTEKLRHKAEGEYIQDFVGPLGRPTETEGKKKVCVVGGGVGCAIAYPGLKKFHDCGAEVHAVVGFKNKDLVILEDKFRAASSVLKLMTDDGSYGEKGLVTDALKELIDAGKVACASGTALTISPSARERFYAHIDDYKGTIILRPQELSNAPEVIRRLSIIAMNTAIEMDIYGNVNSTHIMGSSMMNGIGGSGDFSRNAAITIFSAPSPAKGGKIYSVVPMVSHVDHTEHEVMVLVTEQGFADLRGLSPKERAVKIIQNCAHPDFKDALMDYFERACEGNPSHTPHILNEALSWHIRFQKTGSMSV